MCCLLIGIPCSPAAPAQLSPCSKSQRIEVTAQRDWRCRLDSKTQGTHLVRIERQRVDVSLELIDARGTSIVKVNSPTLRAGPELLLHTVDPKRQPTLIVAAVERDTPATTLYVDVDTPSPPAAHDPLTQGLAALTTSATTSADANRDDTERRLRELVAAARLFRAANEPELDAEAELRLAHLYYWSLGDWQKAADAAQRSLKLYAQQKNAVMESHAGALRAASLIELAREQKPDARSAPGSRNLDFYEARRLLEKAAATFHAANMPYDEAHALNNLGLAFFYQSAGGDARVRYERAAQLFAATGERQGEVLALQNLAALEYERGNYAAAIVEFQALLGKMKPSDDEGLYVSILNNYALASYASGRLDQALSSLLTALPLTQHDLNPSHRARTLHSLGRVYLIAGDTERATIFLREALELRRLATTHDRRGLVSSLIRNGDLERDAGNVSTASSLHAEALKNAASDSEKARALLAVGTDQLLSGSAPSAIVTFERALALDLDPSWPVRASLTGGLGRARLLARDPTGRDLLLRAAEVHRAAGDHELAAQDYLFLATHDYRAHKLASALELVGQSIAIYETQRLGAINPDLRATYVASRADAYELQAGLYMALRAAATGSRNKERLAFEALASIESLRLRALEDFRRMSVARPEESGSTNASIVALDEQIASKRHRLDTVLEQQNPSAERVTALRRDLALLRSKLDVSSMSASTGTPDERHDRISIARVQASLPADTALISWLLGEERSWIWCLSRHQAEAFELQGRQRIDDAARALHAQWTSPVSGEAQTERALSHVLLGDADRCLQRHGSILVVPDGVLHSVPVAALWLADSRGQSKRVIETHTVSYRPALSAWRYARSTPSSKSSSILLVGDPVLGGGAAAASYIRPKLRPLPGAGRELSAIASVTRGWRSVSLVRERATRNALLAQPLGDFRVIHFATHALLDVHDPQLSALVLSGSSSLTLRDVMNLRLQTDAVVLGACEGSVGKQYRGQLSLGLSEAFLFAGADNVLGSLWPVSDAATAHYMRTFYEQYVRGRTPSAAARTVSLGMMRDPRYRHPFYWAAFVNLGL